jgi:hypothetical protein
MHCGIQEIKNGELLTHNYWDIVRR